MDTGSIYARVAAWLAASPTAQDTASWDDACWRSAKQAVLVHGIAPLLGARMAAQGGFTQAPGWFTEYLGDQYRLNRARIARLRGEAAAIAARSEGLGAIPLKGAALFALPQFDIDQRPMNDLDYLVAPEMRAAFEGVLAGLDYLLSEETPRHREFTCQRFGTEVVFREGEHPDNPVRVEVHTWAGQELLASERVDITRAMREAGAAPRALMLHLAVHAGANAAKRRLRLIQLHDLTLLAPLLDAEDWRWLTALLQESRAASLAYASLRLAERFAALQAPSGALDTLRAASPADLRALLDTAALHEFTALAAPLDFAWELRWLPQGAARCRMRARRALPLHRLALDPVRLRERYGLPLDAPPARAYAIHAMRAFAWPFIVVSRLFQGKR